MQSKIKTLLILFMSVSALTLMGQSTRDVGNFHSVSSGGNVNVKLVKGNSPGLEYKMLKGNAEDLVTEVDDGVLKVKIKSGMWASSKAKAKVIVTYTDLIKGLNASAGSTLMSEETVHGENMKLSSSSGASLRVDIKAEKAKLNSSSGGSLKVGGTATYGKFSASSGANIKAGDLIINEVKADASSGASISCHASKKIEANVSSGGNIKYDGDPEYKDLDRSISGGSISGN